MQVNAHDAIREVHALYMVAFNHAQAHPDDVEGTSQRVDIMLGRSMDLFLPDLASVTQDAVRVMYSRIRPGDHRGAQLAAEELVPYNRPISLDELSTEPQGMIPLLLLYAAIYRKFHNMPIQAKLLMNWRRFVENYAPLLPTV